VCCSGGQIGGFYSLGGKKYACSLVLTGEMEICNEDVKGCSSSKVNMNKLRLKSREGAVGFNEVV
jgi:hypothetical protein